MSGDDGGDRNKEAPLTIANAAAAMRGNDAIRRERIAQS